MDSFDMNTDRSKVLRLEAENARLREELSDREDDIRTEQLWVTHWKEECDKLQEQLAAAQIDAKRYRWLRDLDEDPVMSLAAQYTDMNGSAVSISQRIDAAIDVAMKEEGK